MAIVIRDALGAATVQLSESGIESARVDAELLLCHVLECDRTALLIRDSISEDELEEFIQFVAFRSARVPLQHLTGKAAFRRIEIAVGPGVLIPRPETELLVDKAIDFVRDISEPVIVDLCSGSAAMSVSLAIEIPCSEVHALEFVDEAFAWGQKTVRDHVAEIAMVGSILSLHHGDVRGCEGRELKSLAGKVDVIVANPPYIPSAAIPRDPEVYQYEPHEALFGGEDGMEFVSAIISAAKVLLKPGGLLVMEHGDNQGEDGIPSVPKVLRASGVFTSVSDHNDLAGRPRFTTGVRNADLSIG
jgi:release factor glutamine methyltransferase